MPSTSEPTPHDHADRSAGLLSWMGSRRRLLQAAIASAAALLVPRARALPLVPLVSDLSLECRTPFEGDSPSLATVGRTAGRDVARLRFRLTRPAKVTLETLVTGQGVDSEHAPNVGQAELATREHSLGAGRHTLTWIPDSTMPARTYILRLRARADAGRVAGFQTEARVKTVARVLGVDAGFSVRSVTPGDRAKLVVRTDAFSLSLQVLRCGVELEPTYSNDALAGMPMIDPAYADWSTKRGRPAAIDVSIGSDWPSGLYAVRLDADDGRIGFAPLVVRPAAPEHRIAVVLPTITWQAYNFYDADGDGWGDTWYVRWNRKVTDLSRPHANRGVPYRFRSYDLGFLHWLYRAEKSADFYADEDLERFPNAEALRAAYDLLVFPGHTEYVTTRTFDLVQEFRDRGGNLAFLSANNFFRRVIRRGQVVELVDDWRNLGRPEAALCGVQYVASDRGERRAPFTVVDSDAAPWAFADTGLGAGDQFGLYGIEIDARAASSPPGTTVLARIPDLFGPGRSAEMTYYEHWSGARVFSAGVLNFGGQLPLWPETEQLMQNVWARLAPRLEASPA
jgi:hypothetical protein